MQQRTVLCWIPQHGATTAATAAVSAAAFLTSAINTFTRRTSFWRLPPSEQTAAALTKSSVTVWVTELVEHLTTQFQHATE